MIKCKNIGKLGIHPVYRTKKGMYALAQYSNITEIVPIKRIGKGYWVDKRKKIRTIKRFGTYKSDWDNAKESMGCT